MKIYTYLLFIFFTYLPFSVAIGQSWATKIPYEINEADVFAGMQKVQDGNYVIVLRQVGAIGYTTPITQYMLKYNTTGELLWERTDDFGYVLQGASGAYPRDFAQTSDQRLVTVGNIFGADQAYLFISNIEGDSLFFKAYSQYHLFSEVEVIDNETIICKASAPSSNFILKLNINSGEVIEETPFGSFNNTFLSSNHYLFRHTNISDSVSLSKYSFSGDIILNKKHKPDVWHHDSGAVFDESNAGSIVMFYQSLLVADQNLNITLEVPFEEDGMKVSPISHESTHILATSDGGYLATGNIWDFLTAPFSAARVYMIKLNSNGEQEWVNIYDNFTLGLNYVPFVIEEPDGYVLIGIHVGTEEIWLVKLNKQGLFTNTNRPFVKNNIEVFPNPCTDFIQVNFPNGVPNALIQIIDIQGNRVIQQRTVYKSINKIDVNSLHSGMYFLLALDQSHNILHPSKFAKK